MIKYIKKYTIKRKLYDLGKYKNSIITNLLLSFGYNIDLYNRFSYQNILDKPFKEFFNGIDFDVVFNTWIYRRNNKTTIESLKEQINEIKEFIKCANELSFGRYMEELNSYEAIKLNGEKIHISIDNKLADDYILYVKNNIIKWVDGTTEPFSKITPMYQKHILTETYLWNGRLPAIEAIISSIESTLTKIEEI